MSWTEDYIRDLRSRLAEAKRQGTWISARDVRMFLEMLTWRARVSTTGWRRPNEGRLETIAEMRAKGITHIYLSCTKSCGRADRRIALVDIHLPGRRPLPDDAVFLDIPNLCRFRCVKCGSRNVRMMPSWPSDPNVNGHHHDRG